MLTLDTPDFPNAFDDALKARAKSKLSYRGKLLLPGEDAAIVVTPDTLHTFLNGEPVSAEHPLAMKAAAFEAEIRRSAERDLIRHRQIVVIGRWHAGDRDPKDFEPYVTRKIGRNGTIRSYRYRYRIFPCDGLGSGEGYTMSFDNGADGASAHKALAAFTRRITAPEGLSERAIIALDLPRGVVWCPATGASFPILVSEWTASAAATQDDTSGKHTAPTA
ncbi:hypothetical protein [Shinella zoogloeoides]|uniref:hypothetical protein n=1 Tax=Shinella zoogloeoides TaxID=352475 RepID=UPI000E659400|nr:hypothetical protein [Shinella zoogloeoides]